MSTTLNISIPAGTVSSPLSSFPATLYVTPANGMGGIFASIGDGWEKLYIYDSSDTSLPISVLCWDSASETAQLTVLISIPDQSQDTTFKIIFGNDLGDNPLIGLEGSTAGASAYDANTVATWALCQDPSVSGASVIDGKGTYHGTPQGSMTSDDLVDHGQGKGLQLDGSDDWISFSALPALSSWTMASLVTPSATVSGDGILVINGEGLVFSNGYLAALHGSNVIRRGPSVVNGVTTRLVAVWDGTSMLVYVNGVEVGVALSNNGWGLSGAYRYGSGYLARKPGMTGSAASVSNVVRSAGWIAADTLSVNDLLFGNATVAEVSGQIVVSEELDEIIVTAFTPNVGLVAVVEEIDTLEILGENKASFLVVSEESDEVVISAYCPCVGSVSVSEEADSVLLVATAFPLSIEGAVSVDEYVDRVSIVGVNQANRVSVDEAADEVSVVASTWNVGIVKVREYLDVVSAQMARGESRGAVSIAEAVDSVSAVATTSNVGKVSVTCGLDDVGVVATNERLNVGVVNLTEPVDAVSFQAIVCIGAKVNITEAVDGIDGLLASGNHGTVSIQEEPDVVKVSTKIIMPALGFSRPSWGLSGGMPAPTIGSLRFDRGSIAATSATPPPPTEPIHFTR